MWYIVKQNWPITEKRVAEVKQNARYCGLGGDIWPLDEIDDSSAKTIHEALIKKRGFIDLANGYSFLACIDLELAKQYFYVANSIFPNCMLLGLEEPEKIVSVNGYDYGNPSGGYSIIESELIIEDSSPNDMIIYLNDDYLFSTCSILNKYMSMRNEEQCEDYRSYVAIGLQLIL